MRNTGFFMFDLTPFSKHERAKMSSSLPDPISLLADIIAILVIPCYVPVNPILTMTNLPHVPKPSEASRLGTGP
jgi:hypothetical protein